MQRPEVGNQRGTYQPVEQVRGNRRAGGRVRSSRNILLRAATRDSLSGRGSRRRRPTRVHHPSACQPAFGDAVAVGATYLGAAIVPLWPYFFFPLNLALAISLICTLLALFAVGVAKGKVTRLSLLRSGLQVMIVGSISAGVGFAIGDLVTTLLDRNRANPAQAKPSVARQSRLGRKGAVRRLADPRPSEQAASDPLHRAASLATSRCEVVPSAFWVRGVRRGTGNHSFLS